MGTSNGKRRRKEGVAARRSPLLSVPAPCLMQRVAEYAPQNLAVCETSTKPRSSLPMRVTSYVHNTHQQTHQENNKSSPSQTFRAYTTPHTHTHTHSKCN